MYDGIVKINFVKLEFLYELILIGELFYILLEMYCYYGKGNFGFFFYDIYVYGMLFWVLCEGFGYVWFVVYENLNRNEM